MAQIVYCIAQPDCKRFWEEKRGTPHPKFPHLKCTEILFTLFPNGRMRAQVSYTEEDEPSVCLPTF